MYCRFRYEAPYEASKNNSLQQDNKTWIENSGVRKCWAKSENKGYYWTIGNGEKCELSELTKLIEKKSTENAFTKEEKKFYEEKEVSNHSLISLPSGLKEKSDVHMPKLLGKETFKMRLHYSYTE